MNTYHVTVPVERYESTETVVVQAAGFQVVGGDLLFYDKGSTVHGFRNWVYVKRIVNDE
jgi:hypothetical protein